MDDPNSKPCKAACTSAFFLRSAAILRAYCKSFLALFQTLYQTLVAVHRRCVVFLQRRYGHDSTKPCSYIIKHQKYTIT